MIPPAQQQEVLRLARDALEAAARGRSYYLPRNVPPQLTSRRAGVFLTLVKEGKLRACWGTLEPQQRHLVEEIVTVAKGVCVRDTRFPPLRADEVRKLRIILTLVVSQPEPISPEHIRPREHGVLIRSGSRSAVVLPHEGRTVRRMLTIARQKAGIRNAEPVEVYVFRVYTIEEPESSGPRL
ncbi:MAG: AMMECR1 domain-containing protein [Armatimonadota bacterium]|nr:AMMECR1 family protein [bacterium]MDW8321326.1 AMMECR1 domain-containing protein [Armatimonadota bacterium]